MQRNFAHWQRATTGLLTLFVLFALAGCASGPKIYANVDNGVDFTAYRTFGFFPRLATDKQDYQSLESRYLKTATIRELNRRGLTQSDDPDLIINFYINEKEKIVSRTTPAYGGYYGYRSRYYGVWGGYETQIEQYTVGTLNVDIVDATTRTLVWEGIVVSRVTEDSQTYLEESLRMAIQEVFKRFPLAPTAGLEKT